MPVDLNFARSADKSSDQNRSFSPVAPHDTVLRSFSESLFEQMGLVSTEVVGVVITVQLTLSRLSGLAGDHCFNFRWGLEFGWKEFGVPGSKIDGVKLSSGARSVVVRHLIY